VVVRVVRQVTAGADRFEQDDACVVGKLRHQSVGKFLSDTRGVQQVPDPGAECVQQ
jgi:hypothetical protein